MDIIMYVHAYNVYTSGAAAVKMWFEKFHFK